MSRIDHHFGELRRFGDARPRLWMLAIDDRMYLFSSQELARGELDVELPHWFRREGWPVLLKALLRHYRWRRRQSSSPQLLTQTKGD